VKNNLDPSGQHSKEKIQEILEEVGLWAKFSKLKGIDSDIERGGSNLSQGEKQLVCLARALLNQNKIVLMDEATANIDSQTEAKIQELIAKRFAQSTIFMIAHRLNTILNCDK
jgi:ABC-type multidrug transport system fused ATPase/permease subunit